MAKANWLKVNPSQGSGNATVNVSSTAEHTGRKARTTTLTDGCYGTMFLRCSNLNYIKMLATDISAISCLSNWVYGVSSTGTFVKNPAMTSLPSGIDGIPSRWTVVNNGDE